MKTSTRYHIRQVTGGHTRLYSLQAFPTCITAGITSDCNLDTALHVIKEVRKLWSKSKSTFELVKIETATTTVDETKPPQPTHGQLINYYHTLVNQLFEFRDILRNDLTEACRERDNTQERIDNFSITSGTTPRQLSNLKRYHAGRISAFHKALRLIAGLNFSRETAKRPQLNKLRIF